MNNIINGTLSPKWSGIANLIVDYYISLEGVKQILEKYRL